MALNQKCVSLNEEKYLASSDEDQIAVSFVCDSQLLIVRICMRPHIVVDIKNINSTGTRMLQEGTG